MLAKLPLPVTCWRDVLAMTPTMIAFRVKNLEARSDEIMLTCEGQLSYGRQIESKAAAIFGRTYMRKPRPKQIVDRNRSVNNCAARCVSSWGAGRIACIQIWQVQPVIQSDIKLICSCRQRTAQQVVPPPLPYTSAQKYVSVTGLHAVLRPGPRLAYCVVSSYRRLRCSE